MAKPSKVQLAEITAAERAEIPSDMAAVSVNYDSGLVVQGPVFTTSQDRRLRVYPGATVSWPGAVAKLGMTANGQVPFTPPPFHTQITAKASHTFAAGERVVVMKPRIPPVGLVYIDDAALIECETSFSAPPALHASWPTSITGFTSADVQDFLDDTAFWLETRAGWSGRYGHPDFTTPGSGADAGYGGNMAVVTSFGAMLLCSNLSSALKQQVQDRMLLMADDLERFGITYDADGGHCNGRYILWLIRKAVLGNPSTIFTSANFSENQQIYRNGSNQIAWRFNTAGTGDPVYQYCCTINRWMGAAVCAKLATFLGANTSDWVTYTIGYMTANLAITPAWYFSMSPRLATIFAANKATIGY